MWRSEFRPGYGWVAVAPDGIYTGPFASEVEADAQCARLNWIAEQTRLRLAEFDEALAAGVDVVTICRAIDAGGPIPDTPIVVEPVRAPTPEKTAPHDRPRVSALGYSPTPFSLARGQTFGKGDNVHSFVHGQRGLNLRTADKLATCFGLELRPREAPRSSR